MSIAFGKQNFYYASRALEEIWLHRLSSRAGISESLQIDKSTVTIIVNQLLDHGILVSSDDDEVADATELAPEELTVHGRGRRRSRLSVNRAFGIMLGFEIQPEAISAVALDMFGNIVATGRRPMDGAYGSNVAEQFCNYLPEFLEQWRHLNQPVLGVGVGVSGIVNPDTGTIVWSTPLRIESEFGFLSRLEGRFEFPIRVENDAKCASWGPLVIDRLADRSDYLTLVVEFEGDDPAKATYDRVSAGLGLVVNGVILHGPDNTAGEFRSTQVDEQSLGQFQMEYHDLIQIKTDPKRRHAFLLEVAQNIGYLVNVLNLKAVYLGGGIERYESELRPLIEEQVQQKWLYNHMSRAECAITFFETGVSPAAYGAAGMMLRTLFTSQTAPDAPNDLLDYALSL